MARRLLTALLLTALLAVPACGGDDGSGGGSGGGNSNGTGGNGGDGNGGNGGNGGVAYPPWGPDDPAIPQRYGALAASADSPPRCEDSAADAPDNAFWNVAFDVCRALTGEGEWPSSTEVPATPSGENAFQACMNEELAVMLEQALRWHADHPGQQPDVAYPSADSTSPCQYRIYEGPVVETDRATDPDEDGPGLVPITLAASSIENASVAIDGDDDVDYYDVGDGGTGLTQLEILAPLEGESRTVTIELRTDTGRTIETTANLPAASSSGSGGTESGESTTEPSTGEESPGAGSETGSADDGTTSSGADS